MDKLDPKADGATPDIVEQNVEQLKALFPEIVTEGRVDFDALRELLGNYTDDREERYSFTWNGKSRARRLAQTPSTGTLRPCREESVNWDTTQNLFIEGENLEVLKLLQKSYHRKIKMIYIDPPYNTGGDLVYPDAFADTIANYMKLTGQRDDGDRPVSSITESSGRYHTKWLNMIYPRLQLARNLLTEDGAIAISIDDHELHNLRHVCDEVFGPENLIGCVTRATGTTTGQDAGTVGSSLDYLLMYSRGTAFTLGGVQLSESDKVRFNREDERGKYSILQLRKTGSADRREDRPSMYYAVEAPDSTKVWPIGPGGYESRWRFGPETYKKFKAEGLIEWLEREEGGYTPYVKYYLEGRVKQVSNLWTDLDGNKKGTIELRELFGRNVFDNPKPTALLERIIQVTTDDDSLVLDFFAGSCTTAHALLSLNVKANAGRRFIMVQLPELCDPKSEAAKAGYANIAEIGKERIRRVLTALQAMDHGRGENNQMQLLSTDEGGPSLDLGFKVLKLDDSNVKEWDASFEDVEGALLSSVENIKSGRGETDVLYELLLKLGLDLAVPMEQRQISGKPVHIIGAGALIVCLADEIGLAVVEGIAALKEELAPETIRVVFKDSGFADDVVKTNAVQILHQAGIEDVRSL